MRIKKTAELQKRSPLFETGDPDFLERSVLEVRLAAAINNLKGKRSFFEHHYALVHAKG